ncbi:MAG TPA: hypothetical protein VF398_07290 [bacterium]|jgi:hypothetical protein
MTDPQKESQPLDKSPLPPENGRELIKVVDRQGQVKMIPRSEYEQKKRRRRRKSGKELPLQDILSLAFIILIILAASYIALKLIK